MTEVLFVEAGDSAESVRRLVGQLQAAKAILVLPDGWTELANTARMRLLQRQAQIQACDLALVTQDDGTRKVARQLGLPVFHHVEEAQRRRWRMHPALPLVDPRRPANELPDPPPWRRKSVYQQLARPSLHQARQQRIRSEGRYRQQTPIWLRWLGYALAGLFVVVFLAGFTLYVLPAATVTLVPGREPVSVTVQVTADPGLEAPDLESNALPARLIETTLEERGTIATTGAQQKPTDSASGVATFSNLGTTPVNIPAGTVVSTSGGTPVSFRTTVPTTLQGGVGARVDVPIQALEPGIQGNVRANTINNVNGALRFRARVSNVGGTFGGGSQLTSVVSQQDKDNLLARVQQRVEDRAYEALAQEVDAGEWLSPESIQVFTIAQAFDQYNDDEAAELGLDLRALVQGVTLEDQQLSDLMLGVLRRSVPERGKVVADTVTVTREPGVDVVGRQVVVTMTVNADYVIPIDPAEVRQTVAGLDPSAAIAQLARRWPLAGRPDIYLDPQWLGTLPVFPSRIQVRVEYEGALADSE